MPTPPEEPPSGRRLGDFEIVREVGRGGMGVVYEAVQVSLNRKVALKVLAAGLGLTPRAVERFHREAEAAARLHHSNIVPVYATGEQDGAHFYAMELIQGPSLDHVIRRLRRPTSESTEAAAPELLATGPYVPSAPAPGSAPLSDSSLSSGSTYFDAVAKMIADVADALDHAHKNGVVHRDVKPSNLLLSQDGRLSVNDFGLARVLEQPGMTVTGEFLGTPAYMSPEQVTAGRVPLDHRTDVYSLGATLYELLTLQPPFTAAGRDQVLAQILQKEPPRPRRLNSKVPVDLETICLKCLEKDPDRRYATAKELADDLRRYANRFAIQAKRPGPLTKLTKWVRRNPALSAAALGLLLAIGLGGYFAWHAYQAEQQLRQKEQRSAIDLGMVAAMAGDLPTAHAKIAEAEALGTPNGELNILRGFVALYSDDTSKAIEEFRQAVDVMPESVAARALLSVAHDRAGDWYAGERVLKEAERLPPRTPKDRLFLGLALSPFDAKTARREVLAAVQEQPSNIGHVFLSTVLWRDAEKTGAIADAEEALEAAQTASRLLPKNPYVEMNAVYAHLAAAAASELIHEQEKAQVYLEAASRLADALSGEPASNLVIEPRFWVAAYRDGITPPLSHTKRLHFPSGIDDPDVAAVEVTVLWRLGEVEKARALLSALKSSDYTLNLKVALALEQADGRPAARAAWAAWAASVDPNKEPIKLLGMIDWLYLTGEPEVVPVMAAKLRASGFRYRPLPAADWDIFLRFWEGKLTEAEFLKAPASSRMITSWRHCVVGMKRLGEGDREGAKEEFTEVYNARTFNQGEWEWCCSFLIRMNTDPEWPKAIPLKKKP